MHHISIKIEQSMIWERGPLKGQAKGLKAVCTERFGPEAVVGLKQDQLIELLEKESDFRWEGDLHTTTNTHEPG